MHCFAYTNLDILLHVFSLSDYLLAEALPYVMANVVASPVLPFRTGSNILSPLMPWAVD